MLSKTSKDTGTAIRRYRKKASMTLKNLSEITDIPIASLSDIETGKRVITVDHMHIIAKGLGITMRKLLRDIEHDEILSKYDDLEFAEIGKGVFCASLTHLMTPRMEPYYFIMDSGSDTKGHLHEWEEEFIFMISGQMELMFGGEKIVLQSGDSAHFNAKVEHYAKNIADVESTYIVIHLQAGNNNK